LVWNKAKGEVLSGLDHGDSKPHVIFARLLADFTASDVDEQTQAVAAAVSVLGFLFSTCVIELRYRALTAHPIHTLSQELHKAFLSWWNSPPDQ
jgi:hypothetical protein